MEVEGVSILSKMMIQRAATQQAVPQQAPTQTKPQALSADMKAAVHQAGLQLIQNGVSQGQQAGYNGQTMKPQAKWELKPPTQGA